MKDPFVAIVIGSKSDLPTVQATTAVLDRLSIPHELRISSAHRTPDATREYVRDAEERGCAIFIAGAGLAAHLAGTVAACTIRPVIGIPMDAGPLRGVDALLSTVQMPGGIPVACLAIGKAGATNAAYLAAQIMGLSNTNITQALRDDRKVMAAAVDAQNATLQNDTPLSK